MQVVKVDVENYTVKVGCSLKCSEYVGGTDTVKVVTKRNWKSDADIVEVVSLEWWKWSGDTYVEIVW